MSWRDEVLGASAVEQARMIRRGLLSSEELTSLYLERIDAIDPELSAFTEVHHERALFAARRRDRERRGKGELGPFHGVPTGVKDLNFVRGMFTRFGSKAFCVLSPTDDVVTKLLRAGGFVLVGKTTTSELGALPFVEPDIHPPTRNAWSPEHTAGGSSGGAGAAVGAGMLPLAPGSDGAGSVRIPCAFNHLFGLKPSKGRVPNAFGLDDRELIYTCGPMARTVDDAALLLDVLAGTLPGGEPHWAPAPERPFHELARERPPRLRVRVVTRSPLGPTHPEIERAVLRVSEALAALGHRVDEGAVLVGTLEEFLPVWQHQAAKAPIGDWSATEPVTKWLADHGRHVRDDDVIACKRDLEERIVDWFGDTELMVLPTTSVLPGPVGGLKHLAPPDMFASAAPYGYFTAPFNVTGQPAATVPAGLSRDGRPIGVQLVGRPFDDATVLAVARELEEALPWHARVSPRWSAAEPRR